MEVYRPLVMYEKSKMRMYEVWEVQTLCDEFLSFLTLIKFNTKDQIQFNLSKLPSVI